MFLFACTYLMTDAMVRSLTALYRGQVLGLPKAMFWFFPAVLACAPVLNSLYDEAQFAAGETVGISNSQVSVWLSLTGSLVLALGVILMRLRGVKAGQRLSFWGTGALVLCLTMSAIVSTAAGKQLMFADKHAGMVNWEFFAKSVSDLHCEAGILLARQEPGATIEYRCPTKLILNRYSSAPYVPWPDYVEGNSPQLTAAIKEIERNSVKPQADQ